MEAPPLHIMVFGTFDLLHKGHLFLLREATRRGRMTVVVARSENVQRIKGLPPVQTDDERREVIEKAFPSATVILGTENDFLSPIREHKPDLLLFGYDQRLPPGVQENDLQCPIERAEAFEPQTYKSSLMKKTETPHESF
jgi:cytidyltransferase-like protein